MTDQDNLKPLKNARDLYLVFIIGLVCSVLPVVWGFGSIAVIVAIIMAYYYRGQYKDTAAEPHFKNMIRSFWIIGAVILPIMTIVCTGFLLLYGDNSAIENLINPNTMNIPDFATIEAATHKYMRDNGILIFVPLAPPYLWWLYKMIIGLKVTLEQLK